MRRREIVILSLLLAGILSVGFITNAASFVSNALASAADLIVSVFIAFYLVDRISNRERARKWQKVKVLSYRAAEAACELMMLAFQTAPPLMTRVPLSHQEKVAGQRLFYESFFALGKEITDKIDELSEAKPIVVDPTMQGSSASEIWQDGKRIVPDEKRATALHIEQLHEISSQFLLMTVAPHFDKLSLNIFPTILELDENADLISSFLEVESAYRDWASTVDIVEDDYGMPEQFAWSAASEFCDKVGEMLKIIYLEERKINSPKK